MFSPTAGPSSSRTSPSERKRLPRTSTCATLQPLAGHDLRVGAPDHESATSSTPRHDLQRDHDAAQPAAPRAAHARAPLRPQERRLVGIRERQVRRGGQAAASAGGRVAPAALASCPAPPQQLLAGGPHAARAQGQHHVALARLGGQPLDRGLAGRPRSARLAVAACGDRRRPAPPRSRPRWAPRPRRRCPSAAARRPGGTRGRTRPTGAACACSGAAGTAPPCAARPRAGAAPPAWRGSRWGGGRSRRPPARRPPRRAPGSGGPRR